jgi:hypothetical protein
MKRDFREGTQKQRPSYQSDEEGQRGLRCLSNSYRIARRGNLILPFTILITHFCISKKKLFMAQITIFEMVSKR